MNEKVDEAFGALKAEKNVELFEELICQQDIRNPEFAEAALAQDF